MSTDEFLDCTPRYFDTLCKQLRRKRRYEEAMLAQLTAVTLNSSFRAPEQPIRTEQFYLTRDPDAPATAAPKKKTRQQIAAEVRATMMALFSRQGN